MNPREPVERYLEHLADQINERSTPAPLGLDELHQRAGRRHQRKQRQRASLAIAGLAVTITATVVIAQTLGSSPEVRLSTTPVTTGPTTSTIAITEFRLEPGSVPDGFEVLREGTSRAPGTLDRTGQPAVVVSLTYRQLDGTGQIILEITHNSELPLDPTSLIDGTTTRIRGVEAIESRSDLIQLIWNDRTGDHVALTGRAVQYEQLLTVAESLVEVRE